MRRFFSLLTALSIAFVAGAAGVSRHHLQRQADEGPLKVWHSESFRIEMKSPLPAADLERLARVADATATAVEAHPLPFHAPPGARSRITVFESVEDYVAQGGARGTAGFYQGRGEPRVLILADHLRRATHERATRLAPLMNDDLVVHEIVHLRMHEANPRLPQWLQEGVAEWFASAHRGDGRFEWRDMDTAVRDHLRVRLNPADPRIPLVPIASISGLGHREWLAHLMAMPENERYRAYATSLLLAHYHLQGSSERLEAVRAALLRAPDHRAGPPRLIDPGDGPALQEILTRYWKPRGLTLDFAPGDKR